LPRNIKKARSLAVNIGAYIPDWCSLHL